ncbi:MAG: hypothetical protein HYS05_05390 [Acidobacteria bacterium]|nr:hypothetical protein [Acidobacteriota bacterium]
MTWISQSGCWYLFIADANWGMLKRDVDLSRYIVECRQRSGALLSVYFCGSKNTPDRVAEISRIIHEVGMVSCQSVALQTMNPETLRRVNRDNIKTAAYTQIQQTLNDQGIASFVELIWPLPGETLASFQEGVAALCRIGADCFLVYPLLLINNVELNDKRQEYGLVTVQDPDPNSEAEIVVQTTEVDASAYQEGCRYTYAATGLYTMRGLRCLARYLDDCRRVSFAELFRAFVDFWQRTPGHPWTVFCETSIQSLENVTFSNTGALLHLALHAERDAFDELLEDFVSEQAFWGAPRARFLFELDLINRPYIYRNTPITAKRHRFNHLRVADVLPDGYLVEVPPSFLCQVVKYLPLPNAETSATRFTVNHRRSTLPFMPRKSLQEHYMYCQDMSQRMRDLVPVWRSTQGGAALAAPALYGTVVSRVGIEHGESEGRSHFPEV